MNPDGLYVGAQQGRQAADDRGVLCASIPQPWNSEFRVDLDLRCQSVVEGELNRKALTEIKLLIRRSNITAALAGVGHV